MISHGLFNNAPSIIGGLKVITVPPAKIRVKRSWRERLFSLTPWVSHRIEIQQVLTDGEILRTAEGIFCNAATKQQIERLLAPVDRSWL